MTKQRELIDLVSVGPAVLECLEDLGITEVAQLVDKDATELYEELKVIRKVRIDPCVHDVFRCVIEQARDPELPDEKSGFCCGCHVPPW